MSWEPIECNWQHLKQTVQERWDNLSDAVFAEINGRRDRLACRIQEAYGLSSAEAEHHVKAFEKANQDYRPPQLP